MSVFDYSVRAIDGSTFALNEYAGKVLLIVNTALDCGFAPQYNELEVLNRKYHDQGFEVLDFPCNQFAGQSPLEDAENATACQLRYATTFPVFAKVEVNGEGSDPLFKYLKDAQKGFLVSTIKWNFTKFLVDREGQVVARFGPKETPLSFEDEIIKVLA